MKRGKRKDEGLPRRIHTRLTQKKYDELSAMLSQSNGIRSLSELLRHILDHKTITVKTYDATADMIVNELALIRKELLAIGININQVARVMHGLILPADKLAEAGEIIAFIEQTDRKINELFGMLDKFSQTWSRG